MKNGERYWRKDHRGDKYPLVDTGLNHCLTPFCRGKVNKKKEHSPYCTGCRREMWREKNPLKYSFGNLRRRAKQRGKDFSLTFEQYREFAIKTDYARLKGKTSLSLSINRKDNSQGYHHWNIEAITLSSNSRRQFVPYFARQIENSTYEPSAEELAAVAAQMDE